MSETAETLLNIPTALQLLEKMRESTHHAVSRGADAAILIPVAGWEKESIPGDEISYNLGANVVKHEDGVLAIAIKIADNIAEDRREEAIIQAYIADNMDSLTVDGKGERFTEQGVKDLISFLQGEGFTVTVTDMLTEMKKTLLKPRVLKSVRAHVAVDNKFVEVILKLPEG